MCIICALVWTVYTNIFQQTNRYKDLVLGSNNVENFLQERNESTERLESNDVNISDDDYNDYEHEDGVNIYASGEELHLHEYEHSHEHEINSTEVIEVNSQAKDFVTKSLEGKTVKLSDYLGKKVILNFWTTWCPPCQEETPLLIEFYETINIMENIEFLSVNITEQDLGVEVVKEFKDYYGITYPILLDETGNISESYEIITIPTTYVIDEKGNIEKQIIGPLTEEIIREIIEY